MLGRILKPFLKPLITAIMDEEIKNRVNAQVAKELKSQIANLTPKESNIITKNVKGDMGKFIEDITNSSYKLSRINLEITGKTEIDTYGRYKKIFDKSPLKELYSALHPDKMVYLEEALADLNLRWVSDVDFSINFVYKGTTHYKSYFIFDGKTTEKEAVKLIHTLYKILHKDYIEMMI